MATLRVPSRGLAAVAALALLAACAERPEPTAPAAPSLAQTATGGSAAAAAETGFGEVPLPELRPYGGEQEYDEVAEQVPGYAGHWYDENGDRVVLLTDLSQAALAERVIDGRPQPAPTDDEKRTGVTRFEQARYDWPTLRDWRNLASDPVLDVKGAVFLDAHEGSNRLFVGVLDAAAKAGVESQLTALRIPLAAVTIAITGGADPHQTLQNFFRPLQGGYQIQNAGGGTCSLGPPVPNTPAPAYFTASHCTQAFWANTGTNFYQHVVGAPFLVGPEISDPAGWACPAGSLWRCRWSNVARVGVAAGTTAANQVARTTFSALNWAAGSINTAGVPAFNVVNPPQWWPLNGQLVHKVGRTTGWNRGIVDFTCVNVNANPAIPPFRRVMCQYYARYASAPGDSGAPVFILVGGGAKITGVNWGAVNLGGPWGWRAVFSPSGGIAADGV